MNKEKTGFVTAAEALWFLPQYRIVCRCQSDPGVTAVACAMIAWCSSALFARASRTGHGRLLLQNVDDKPGWVVQYLYRVRMFAAGKADHELLPAFKYADVIDL
ncbi:hypothetical protein CCHOA_09250 [Corynebacterium choanae]|uniref:Uncharacterized protein n=1 Tax=Corynebacterium choanae TaxID=1862358 RepID=A0A3G6J8Y2_9CORY|nr:hypothetical protein CCHOA_09250 [Corynebacterium choanae]